MPAIGMDTIRICYNNKSIVCGLTTEYSLVMLFLAHPVLLGPVSWICHITFQGLIVFLFTAVLSCSSFVSAAIQDDKQDKVLDVTETAKLLDRGKYAECIAACEVGIKRAWRVDWWLYKIEAEIKTGKYKDALATAELALENHSGDIRVRWLARQAYRLNDNRDKANLMLSQIDRLVKNTPWRYSDAEDRIVLGQMMLDANADAKKVLELFFDSAKKLRPDLADNYLVAADLALAKSDFDLAVREIKKGLERHPENAELHFRLAQGYWGSDREKGQEALKKTLSLNPFHADALLFRANQAIDQENYSAAKQLARLVLKTNPRNELAFAHLAIVAHLEGDYEQEKEYRKQALSSWTTNPMVDFTIGRKLSQKYRFQEGAQSQRRALEFNPEFVPAKIQLAQDLLRLGQDKEGWALVAEANQLDQYNVLMHNLQALNDEISGFASLSRDGIIVRMSKRESELYGQQVLDLLLDAKTKLTKKYDYEFDRPVIVEIFPRQQDFAIRTFGMPGGIGFLGVCFGHLITANSPASQTETPTNWESVLWHEFCHAVTLGKTRNRMPRWLSEGISVYEERLRNPGSGEKISPTYRKMMLSDDLTPVSQLSAAFLQAKSPEHLQFAYFESSLVIEYLIDKYGLDMLKKVLVDLGAGIAINESLQRYTGSLAELDQAFKKYAIEMAESYGGDLEFTSVELDPMSSSEELRSFFESNPKNFYGQIQLAAALIREKSLIEAEKTLTQLAQQFEDQNGLPIVFEMLSTVYQRLNQVDKELQVLEKLLEVSDNDIDIYRRLSDLYEKRGDWNKMRGAVEKILAVNPLTEDPYRRLAIAGEKLKDPSVSIRALESLLQFENTDVADTHFRLARIQLGQNDLVGARKNVLLALAEAPRYRAAHRLLLEINALRSTK